KNSNFELQDTQQRADCWHLALLFRLGVTLSSDPPWFNIFSIINLSERVKVGQVFHCTNHGFISCFYDKYIIFSRDGSYLFVCWL
ncbi:unnamed protein product, partial [Callosobruchus maculatus]